MLRELYFFLSFQKDHTCSLLKNLNQIYQSLSPYKATSINLNSESTQRLIKDYNHGVSWGLYKKSYTSFLPDFRLHWIQLSLMKRYRGIQDVDLVRWQMSCKRRGEGGELSFSKQCAVINLKDHHGKRIFNILDWKRLHRYTKSSKKIEKDVNFLSVWICL